MAKKHAELLYWVDIETTGLSAKDDHILELGIQVTNLDLSILDAQSWRVWTPVIAQRHITMQMEAELADTKQAEASKFVLEMHDKSGLWNDAMQHGGTPDQLIEGATKFLDEWGIDPKSDPMCGSSVGFDREFLGEHYPEVLSRFHYRNIDISTLKELCKRVNPRMYSFLDRDTARLQVEPLHRALPDLVNSRVEAKWYFDNFLHVAPNLG